MKKPRFPRAGKTSCFVLIFALFTSCGRFVSDPAESDDEQKIFETVWRDFDNIYPYFSHKQVDWKAVHDEYIDEFDADRRGVRPLDTILGEMLMRLRDGHVRLLTQREDFRYPVNAPDTPRNFNFGITKYFFSILTIPPIDEPLPYFFRIRQVQISQTGPAVFAPVGYFYLNRFAGEEKERWQRSFDLIFDAPEIFDGLIIDIRDNVGGSDALALYLAGKFTADEVAFGNIQRRNGPKNDDLTKPEPRFVKPTAATPCTKPVTVLTNRWTFSAAESFVLAMRAASNAVVLGDTTGGSSGGPVTKELPNGWLYSISTWIETDLNGAVIEDSGIAPDEAIDTQEALQSGQDLILEAAFNVIRERIRLGQFP